MESDVRALQISIVVALVIASLCVAAVRSVGCEVALEKPIAETVACLVMRDPYAP